MAEFEGNNACISGHIAHSHKTPFQFLKMIGRPDFWLVFFSILIVPMATVTMVTLFSSVA